MTVAGSFARPATGLSLFVEGESRVAWRSNGGPVRGHPARALPFSLECEIPRAGELLGFELIGVFAFFAGSDCEARGTVGASIHLEEGREAVWRQELINGRHYGDAEDEAGGGFAPGDGSRLELIDQVEVEGKPCRLDRLTFELPQPIAAERLRFRDLGSPASFAIAEIRFRFRPVDGCPFRPRGGQISLLEVGAIVRLGDRARFEQAVDQLQVGLARTANLDDARGQALTFLAIVTAAMLERGGDRELHRFQLEAARRLEGAKDAGQVADEARALVMEATEGLFTPMTSPNAHLMDRALAILERNYARPLNDATLADQLGLSTSHFRYLFREATGQPFHKYLVSLRLEKARAFLLEEDVSVSSVAEAVGFSALSHFSRAFTQRFGVSPTAVRRRS